VSVQAKTVWPVRSFCSVKGINSFIVAPDFSTDPVVNARVKFDGFP
jgi:hypothetical protein